MSDPNTERRIAYLERLTEPAPPRSEALTVADE